MNSVCDVGTPGPHAPNWSGWIKVGAWMAALSVMFGAIAAHGIDHYLANQYAGETREIVGQSIPAAQKYLEDFKTASRYQMSHALGLILIGLLSTFQPRRVLTAAAWCHLGGIVMFCGSLYVLSLMAHALGPGVRHAIGLTAACGGTTMIVGWGLLAAGVCRCHSPATAARSTDKATPAG